MDHDLTLSPPIELALAYAPRPARELWRGLLVLDARLGRTAQSAREPLLAQIKLAWWRDRFAEAAAVWPGGEPLLALLRPWDNERAALAALVDGWEGMIGEPGPRAVEALVGARAEAVAALARVVGRGDSAENARLIAGAWARSDLAGRGDDGGARSDPAAAKLPRELRPLAVLLDLTRSEPRGVRGFGRIVRLGLFGR